MMNAKGTIAPWMASVTFGWPDLKTVYLGSLMGNRIGRSGSDLRVSSTCGVTLNIRNCQIQLLLVTAISWGLARYFDKNRFMRK